MSEAEKAPIQTICRDCLFATWDGRKQLGCWFDKINKYKNAGVEITEETEGDMTCFSINALCTTARAIDWRHASSGQTILELMKIARDEARITVDCIIMCNDYDEEKLLITIKDALAQSRKFKSIIIATPNENPTDFIVFCIEKIAANAQWEVVQISEQARPEKIKLEDYYLDQAVEKSTAIYYALYQCGDRIPERLVESIDYSIGDVLHRFIMVLPSAYTDNKIHGLVMQSSASKYMGHFGEHGLINKLKQRLEEEIWDGVLTENQREQLITTHEKIQSYLVNL